jgi:hypothetical protein
MPARLIAWTDVANRALASIGQDRIESLGESSQNAQYISLFLEEAIDHVSAYHQWHSTRARAQLARDGTDPVSEWDHQYRLPSDFLMLGRDETDNAMVYATAQQTGIIAFHIEGSFLLTDAEEVWIVYHRSPEAPIGYPPSLITAITYALAERLSTILASNESLRSLATNQATKALNAAVSADQANTSRLTPEAERGYEYTFEAR